VYLGITHEYPNSHYSVQAEARDRYPDQLLTAEKLGTLHILGRVKLITHIR